MADLIERYSNFPIEHVQYFCVQKLLLHPDRLKDVIDKMQENIPKQVTKIVALDARGFIFASMLAERMKLGLVLVRKAGKLPGQCHQSNYTKEYGSDIFCVQKSALNEKDIVVIVDDVLATGGTANAAADLVRQCNATLSSFSFVLQIGKDVTHLTAAPVNSVFYTNENHQVKPYHNSWLKELDVAVALHQYPCHEQNTIVFFHPKSKILACQYVRQNIKTRRLGKVSWNKFADGWPDMQFEPYEELKKKKIVYIFNLETPDTVVEQLCLLLALCRQTATSLDILIPYFGPGTMELVNKEGVLATAEPMLKLISRIIPSNGTKVTTFILDIHNTCERFYLSDTVTPVLIDSASIILGIVANQSTVVVFPDAGAFKRFGHHLQNQEIPAIVFCKTRLGEDRKMILQTTDDPDLKAKKFIIWDDLVHSGKTLLECANALHSIYEGPITVDVFVTHCIMENNAHLSFLNSSDINRIYTTDSVCHIMPILRKYPNKFYIFPCMKLFDTSMYIKEDFKYSGYGMNVVLSSQSAVKRESLEQGYVGNLIRIKTMQCTSGVNEQPIGWEEIILGALKRHEYIRSHHGIYISILISMETGLVRKDEEHYMDVAIIVIEDFILHSKKFVVKQCAVISVNQFNEYKTWLQRHGKTEETTTFGDYLKASGLCTDAQDWYSVVPPNTRTRSQALQFCQWECIDFHHATDILRHVVNTG